MYFNLSFWGWANPGGGSRLQCCSMSARTRVRHQYRVMHKLPLSQTIKLWVYCMSTSRHAVHVSASWELQTDNYLLLPMTVMGWNSCTVQITGNLTLARPRNASARRVPVSMSTCTRECKCLYSQVVGATLASASTCKSLHRRRMLADTYGL